MKRSDYYDFAGIKYKFPDRSCKQCAKYPCNEDIIKLDTDFAKYGCIRFE